MTFVCGPDQAFAEKAKGPSSVDWRACFSQYKCIVLCLPPAHHSWLLAWYDKCLFSRSTTSAVQTNPGTFESGYNEIDDLIQWLGDADIDSPFNPLLSASPSFQYPASPSLVSLSSQRPASLPPKGDAAMSEPNVPNMPSTGAVEIETVVRSKAKKATRAAPCAKHVKSTRKGVNLH